MIWGIDMWRLTQIIEAKGLKDYLLKLSYNISIDFMCKESQCFMNIEMK